MAWRFNFRRSRSDSPPQIPKRSSLANAYSKHSARTVQLEHTRFASRVDPPFSGKNASGSVCAHNACWCQANSSSAFTPNVQMSSILPPLWPKLHTCGSFASSPSGESACTKTGRTNPHHPPTVHHPPEMESQGETTCSVLTVGPPPTVTAETSSALMDHHRLENRDPRRQIKLKVEGMTQSYLRQMGEQPRSGLPHVLRLVKCPRPTLLLRVHA